MENYKETRYNIFIAELCGDINFNVNEDIQMSADFLYKLKKEYSASGLPTVIADEGMNILWANGPGNFILLESDSDARFIFGDSAPQTGLFAKNRGGESLLFNSVRLGDPYGGRSFYVIELISSEKISSIVSYAAVRDYMSYLSAKIRTVLANISVTSDRLFEDVSIGASDSGFITDGLNRIQEDIMSLAREAIQPEQLYMLCDTQKTDEVLLLDSKMSEIAEVIRKRLGSAVKVIEDYDKGIYFHMNADAFEAMIAFMTAECCCTRLYPDRVILSGKRIADNRAEITVMLVNLDGKANNICCTAAAEADERGLNRNLFFGYISDILNMRNGVKVARQDMPGGVLYKMEMNVLPPNVSVLSDRACGYNTDHSGLSEKIDFFLGDVRTGQKYHLLPEDEPIKK